MGLKEGAKSWVKKAAVRTGALRLGHRFCPAGVAVLGYHSVQDRPERHAKSIGLGITQATSIFEQQMKAIAECFNCVTLDDVLAFVSGALTLPPRSVAVTFDDGFADNLEIVAPILSRYGIRAAFYIMVGAIEAPSPPWYSRLRHAFANTLKGVWFDSWAARARSLSTSRERNAALVAAWEHCARQSGSQLQDTVVAIEQQLGVAPLSTEDCRMMNWNQVRSLVSAGHIVGSHTVSHPNLAYLGDCVAFHELVESKRRLEERLGVEVRHFSYPHPALDPQWTECTERLTRRAGYSTAVTTTRGPVRLGHNAFLLRRVFPSDVLPSTDRDGFLWIVEGTLLGRGL